MTLNGVMAIMLSYFTEFGGSFRDPLPLKIDTFCDRSSPKQLVSLATTSGNIRGCY